MAQDLRVKMTLDDAGFRDRLSQNAEEIKNMGSAATPAAQSLAQMTAQLVKQTQASTNYMGQAKKLSKQLIDLKINYEGLSEAEKNSDFGKNLLRAMAEIEQKAATFQDMAADVKEGIKNMASDTAKFDGLAQGFDIASEAVKTFVSITGQGKKSTEELAQVLVKLQAVESGFATVIKITNALQKQSALMTSIRALQSAAARKAILAETAATNGATAAQKLFNMVAKANPYVLLATAIIGVGTALFAFAKKSKEAAAAEKELAAATEKAKEAAEKQKKYYDSITDAASKLITKYRLLQEAYKKLTNEQEKVKWIKENQKAFDELGISINSVKDAEEAFIKNTSKMVEAFKLRAQAAAVQNLLQEEYKKKLDRETTLETRRGKIAADKVTAGQQIVGDQVSRYGLQEGTDYYRKQGQVGMFYTPAGAQKANKLAKN